MCTCLGQLPGHSTAGTTGAAIRHSTSLLQGRVTRLILMDTVVCPTWNHLLKPSRRTNENLCQFSAEFQALKSATPLNYSYIIVRVDCTLRYHKYQLLLLFRSSINSAYMVATDIHKVLQLLTYHYYGSSTWNKKVNQAKFWIYLAFAEPSLIKHTFIDVYNSKTNTVKMTGNLKTRKEVLVCSRVIVNPHLNVCFPRSFKPGYFRK